MLKLVNAFKNSIIESMGDGYGFRLVLFLQGCPHHCKGCQNPSTWNVNGGVEYSIDDLFLCLQDIIDQGGYDGITFSGGDPLYQHEELNKLIFLIKDKYPELNITVYTGYVYEKIKELPIIKNIDYLVDGKFEQSLLSTTTKFRGSSNQRLLHLKDGLIAKIE